MRDETTLSRNEEGDRPARPPATAGSTPAWAGFTPESDHFAEQLRETAGAVFLYGSMGRIFQQMDCYAFKTYRDRLVADCGNPTDPIEVMMIEQIALAHMSIGRLQFNSATAGSIEAARTYGAMATQLLGEFRRTALALKGYRTETQAGAFDEGLSASPAKADSDQKASKEEVDSELGNNPGDQDHGDDTIPLPESAQGRGGKTEPGEMARVHARGA
jgi:hypothetical protein